MPRGRQQATKPGYTIKAVLSRKVPLVSGELVTEACSTDIHNAYKTLLKEENREHELLGKKSLHGMTATSFVKLMAFARLLGLIEFTREEPFRGHGGPLYRADKTDDVLTVQVVHRRLYRLTEKGSRELMMWNDLTKAYKDSL